MNYLPAINEPWTGPAIQVVGIKGPQAMVVVRPAYMDCDTVKYRRECCDA